MSFYKWQLMFKTCFLVLRVRDKKKLNDNLRKTFYFQILMCMGKLILLQ